MSKDMPAGYDEKLEAEFDPMPDLDQQFSAPPKLDESDSSGSEIDAQLFGGGDYDPTDVSRKSSGTSIFEAAIKAEQERAKKKGNGVPAYVKELLEASGRRLTEDEDEEEEDDDTEEMDIDTDDDFDDSDIDFDAGGSGDDFSDGDDDDDFEFDEVDDDEDDFETADEDVLQTDEWRSEEEVDEEMSRLLGDDSPYVQGATTGAKHSYQFDPNQSATLANSRAGKSEVDDDLVSASRFQSGGFIEYFDDGFVYVSQKGPSMAVVDATDEGDELDDSPTNLRAVMVFNSTGEEDDDIVVEFTKEEIDELVGAFSNFGSQTIENTPAAFFEHARQKAKRIAGQSKKKQRK